MFSLRKALLVLLTLLAVVFATIGLRWAYFTALLGSGFTAETLCSGIFVSGRDRASIFAEELTGPGYELLQLFQAEIDDQQKQVTASTYGLWPRTAVYREGLGCTLAIGKTPSELRAEAANLFPAMPPPEPNALWPEGERVDLETLSNDIDHAALTAAIDAAFAEPDPSHPRRTRALVVVHKGRIVAERYASGFDQNTPLVGWSMTKTATNALVALRVLDGAVATSNDKLLPEWRDEGDARSAITLDQLLRMTSGLAFDEGYGSNTSDVAQMLFAKESAGRFAAEKPLLAPPGTLWNYSSGTSNVIQLILRHGFTDQRDYLRFPHERLFDPLFMRTAVLEPDASGSFIGSSLMYASARDWARLALLFAQSGVWQGKPLLPPNWVSYSLTPTPEAPNKEFGAHVWLKLPESEQASLAADAYYLLGFDQQIVAIIPSRDLIIVRLGLTRKGGDWDHARDLAQIVRAFSAKTTGP
jgi:CubicO group peptidase (beta-lactamase class C family)